MRVNHSKTPELGLEQPCGACVPKTQSFSASCGMPFVFEMPTSIIMCVYTRAEACGEADDWDGEAPSTPYHA